MNLILIFVDEIYIFEQESRELHKDLKIFKARLMDGKMKIYKKFFKDSSAEIVLKATKAGHVVVTAVPNHGNIR